MLFFLEKERFHNSSQLKENSTFHQENYMDGLRLEQRRLIFVKCYIITLNRSRLSFVPFFNILEITMRWIEFQRKEN